MLVYWALYICANYCDKYMKIGKTYRLKTWRSVLRVTDSKYRESVDRFEKSKTLKLCRKNAFRELCSKMFFPFSIVFEKFAKNENTPFSLIKYAKNIGKIDKLGIRIEIIYDFRTRDKLSTKASPFFYLTVGSFDFFT